MSAATRRPVSAAPKAPTSISSSCVIAETATLLGRDLIRISANAIIHPRARLNSAYGPVTLEEGCIVWERASIGLLSEVEDEEGIMSEGVEVGKNVTVEAEATIEAQSIGEGTVIGYAARIGKGSVLGKYCKITPLSTVAPGEIISDYTVVYGQNERRVEKPGLENSREATHKKQIEVLTKLIPNNAAKWQ